MEVEQVSGIEVRGAPFISGFFFLYSYLLADFILIGKSGKKRFRVLLKKEFPLAQLVWVLWLFLGQFTMAKKMGASPGQIQLGFSLIWS